MREIIVFLIDTFFILEMGDGGWPWGRWDCAGRLYMALYTNFQPETFFFFGEFDVCL